ncbi:MAG TPA: 16S rRNA (guanine(527)-N(7))-methyltransferase RsmG [Candidatus Limnocylindria bacterium]|nr:16S rRNA (guanine(527)-N(7))-methyltransferase RsmG [Candidatus Limnocylindria bacterium]
MPDFALLESLGIELDTLARERLGAFHAFLLEENAKMDLTNVPEEEMTLRHYADSLLPIRHGLVGGHMRFIDVGSGAGFPGLVLAIALPRAQAALLDARRKRCDFLSNAAERLGLENVRVLWGRAEDMARPPHREAYDLALARAVAPLNVLCELLLPFVRVGGRALCWKGPALEAETRAGRKASQMLGGRLGKAVSLGIPEREHYVQVVDKTAPTPDKYPRKAGLPEKAPLGEA